MPICLFYLVLRGLDTIEDDMTIDLAKKEPLLRGFADLMEIDGWTFTENGPNEKDRELLVHFDDVITELKKVKKPYYDIIREITVKMGNGMADYALNAEHNTNGVNTIEEYELYCHYVAGLVGEGLTRLFVESNLANPALLERMELTESMGQFLQKTNIIRDIHEDFVDKRRFWPKTIWSKYVNNWEDMFKLENREKALQCSSEMVLNALKHTEECLFYMAGIRDQSVFNFVAIPQAMAIATLELVFRNPAIFERNVKITKGDACQLMMESTQNLRVLCEVFRRYARRIHKKNDPRDPNYLAISVQCGKVRVVLGIYHGGLSLTHYYRSSNLSSPFSPPKTPRKSHSTRSKLPTMTRSTPWALVKPPSWSCPCLVSCSLLAVLWWVFLFVTNNIRVVGLLVHMLTGV